MIAIGKLGPPLSLSPEINPDIWSQMYLCSWLMVLRATLLARTLHPWCWSTSRRCLPFGDSSEVGLQAIFRELCDIQVEDDGLTLMADSVQVAGCSDPR